MMYFMQDYLILNYKFWHGEEGLDSMSRIAIRDVARTASYHESWFVLSFVTYEEQIDSTLRQ